MEGTTTMSKRNLRSVEKESVNKEDHIYTKVERVEAKAIEYKTVLVQLGIDAKVKVTGYVTGNSYLFNGAGSVVDVDERDVQNLLEKRQGGRQCCGGTDYGNAMFSLVEVN